MSLTVTIGGLDLAAQYDPTQPVSGRGDDVFLCRVMPQTVSATHSGGSNFQVEEAMDGMTSPDLAINEIGSGTGTGTVIFPGDGTDAGLVQITADGAWTITPKACNG